MTVSPHERILISYFEAVDRRDLGTLLALFDEAVVYERPGYAPIIGRDALERFYYEERKIECGVHTIEGIVVDAPRAVAWGAFSGAARNGEPLAERWADVYEFRSLSIAYRRTYFFREAI